MFDTKGSLFEGMDSKAGLHEEFSLHLFDSMMKEYFKKKIYFLFE